MIVFSHTGNTHSVALKLKDKLSALGHSVTMEKIEISGNYQSGDFRIQTSPNPEKYEVLIFATPVMAFSLSPVMKSYLTQLESLQNKKVAFLVTEFFPFNGKPFETCESLRRVSRRGFWKLFAWRIVAWPTNATNKELYQFVASLTTRVWQASAVS